MVEIKLLLFQLKEQLQVTGLPSKLIAPLFAVGELKRRNSIRCKISSSEMYESTRC